FGVAADTERIRVLLPALGKPSRPTSASSLSSSRSLRSSPGVPGVDCRGVRLVELLKCMLPSPPLPPCATSRRSPWTVRSPITSSVSTLCTTVPVGTAMSTSSPPLPYICRPMPFSPRRARNCFWWRKSTRVLRFSSATRYTLPPSPPSPPSGPPSGMNFSRRNPTQPLPPLPAVTVISASSTNFMGFGIGDSGVGTAANAVYRHVTRRWAWLFALPNPQSRIPHPVVPALRRNEKAPHAAGPLSGMERGLRLRHHAHGATLLRALDAELDLAVDQREQGVVAAEADARTRVELGAALAHDDVAGSDRLAAVDLDAEVLRVGVAAVAGRTTSLFMCHDCFSLLAATGNAGDLDFGVMLAMPLPLHVVLAAAELDDAHLVGAAVADDLGGDAGALERVADGHAVAAAKHQDVVEGDLVAGFGLELLDAERFALRHAVLLTAGDQYSVHVEPLGVRFCSYSVCLPAIEGGQKRNY